MTLNVDKHWKRGHAKALSATRMWNTNTNQWPHIRHSIVLALFYPATLMSLMKSAAVHLHKPYIVRTSVQPSFWNSRHEGFSIFIDCWRGHLDAQFLNSRTMTGFVCVCVCVYQHRCVCVCVLLYCVLCMRLFGCQGRSVKSRVMDYENIDDKGIQVMSMHDQDWRSRQAHMGPI